MPTTRMSTTRSALLIAFDVAIVLTAHQALHVAHGAAVPLVWIALIGALLSIIGGVLRLLAHHQRRALSAGDASASRLSALLFLATAGFVLWHHQPHAYAWLLGTLGLRSLIRPTLTLHVTSN